MSSAVRFCLVAVPATWVSLLLSATVDAQEKPASAFCEASARGLATAVAYSRYPNGTAQSARHGYRSCCGRSSRISYHGAFEPTNMCAIGLRAGASTSDPYGTRILPS